MSGQSPGGNDIRFVAVSLDGVEVLELYTEFFKMGAGLPNVIVDLFRVIR